VVYAVEFDRKIFELGSGIFSGYMNVKWIHSDILDFALSRISLDGLKVVGALPFSITSPIIEYLINWRKKIRTIYIIIQKEVAGRLTARPGDEDYGSFTLFVGFYTRVKRLMDIRKNSFFPVPKVDATLLRMDVLSSPSVAVRDEDIYLRVVRQAFAGRRKTLLTGLSHKEALGLDRKGVAAALSKAGIDPSRRAETLDAAEFASIADAAIDILS
jgi:16S rRNA (adenine1518-N6/adenine1519-N6)-dimethyltransferase